MANGADCFSIQERPGRRIDSVGAEHVSALAHREANADDAFLALALREGGVLRTGLPAFSMTKNQFLRSGSWRGGRGRILTNRSGVFGFDDLHRASDWSGMPTTPTM